MSTHFLITCSKGKINNLRARTIDKLIENSGRFIMILPERMKGENKDLMQKIYLTSHGLKKAMQDTLLKVSLLFSRALI